MFPKSETMTTYVSTVIDMLVMLPDASVSATALNCSPTKLFGTVPTKLHQSGAKIIILLLLTAIFREETFCTQFVKPNANGEGGGRDCAGGCNLGNVVGGGGDSSSGDSFGGKGGNEGGG